MTLEEALAEISRLREENANRRNENKDLKAQLDAATKERDAATAEQGKLQKKLDKTEADLGTYKFADARKAEVEKLLKAATDKNPRLSVDQAKLEKFLARSTPETLAADIAEGIELFGVEKAAPSTAVRQGMVTETRQTATATGEKPDPFGDMLVGRQSPASVASGT